MDDLDALLADLQQSTHRGSLPQSNSQTTDRNSHSSKNSASSPTDSGIAIDSNDKQINSVIHSYSSSISAGNTDCHGQTQTQGYRSTMSSQNHSNSTGMDSTPVYSQVNSQVPSRHVSTLSSNLSELDSLLQELSSAQFNVELNKRNSNTDSSHPVSSVQSHSYHGGTSHDSRQYEDVNQSPIRGQKGASSATRELDDLMASLSGLSAANKDMSKSSPSPHTASPSVPGVGVGEGRSPVGGGSRQHAVMSGEDANLSAMMEDLSKNMSQQGVTTVTKGHCAACAKPIVGQVITALGRLWHPEHFVCTHCKELIGTKNFFERDSLPYCEKDYHLVFSPRCAHCNGPILDKCVTALDKTWHPEHFCCVECGKLLGDEHGFQEKDGHAYCREDYLRLYAPKCGRCNLAIADSFITALSRQWHPQCFVCADCNMSFGTTSFFEHEGMPYCETHFHAKRGSLCAQCQAPITGRCITAMYRKYHPEHFVCTFCQRQLNKGTFKEHSDKPYCHPCFVKLFA